MDTYDEHDAPTDEPGLPAEPASVVDFYPAPAAEEPSVVPAVAPEPVEVAEPPLEPDEPLEPAEPGIYWCDTPNPGIHPVLGRLLEGENDYSTETNPEKLMALAAVAQSGLLEKM